MSQHDFDIANQSASSARADINNALKALASLSSGPSAPSTTYANMVWYDTANNTLKVRSEADDAWISLGYLNQSTDTFALFDDTQVVNTSGTQTGLLGDQTTATWEAGTGTTESLVSPAKVKAAIDALAQATDLDYSDMLSVGAGAVVLARVNDTTKSGAGTATKGLLVVQRACTLTLKFDVDCESGTSASILKNGVSVQDYDGSNDGANKSVNVSFVAGDYLDLSVTGDADPGGTYSASFENFTVCADVRAPVFIPQL